MIFATRDLSFRAWGRARLLCWILLLPVLMGCAAVTPFSPPTVTPTASLTATATITPTPEPTLTPTPTEIPALCGGPRLMLILLVGSDARADTYRAGLADSVRIVRVDFVEPGIQTLVFPRDLYVEIPGIEDQSGITHGKLNQAYLYGNPGYDYYDGEDQGPGLLTSTLEHNFGARVDHYVAINLQSFIGIVDELGGLDIDLPYTVDGRVSGSRDPDRYFPAGEQHLNGYRTMLLARMRPGGDFQRSEVQNLILQAFAEELLSPETLLYLPEVYVSFRDAVQTDLAPADVRQLLCLRTILDTQNIEYGNFDEDMFESGRVRDPVLGNTSILEADFEVLKEYVQRFNDGSLPESSEDDSDNQ